MNCGGSGLPFQYFLESTEESHVESQRSQVVSWKRAEPGTFPSMSVNQFVMKVSDFALYWKKI
jgi:hypothetical protein